MSLTITVQDPLAAQLVDHAEEEQISVEELAARLLARGLSGDIDASWERIDRQRSLLLEKSASNGLTQAETQELQRIQLAVDQRLEVFDAERLAEVARMEREAHEALQNGSSA
jgi:hypothetical protein